MTDNSGCAVGCDIGGTYCKIGLVEKTGKVKDQTAFAVDHEAGVNHFLSALISSIDKLVSHDRLDPAGIGVLLPGYLKKERMAESLRATVAF